MMQDDDVKILEALIRRIIREELDSYDRDKGITPRMSRSGQSAYGPRYDACGNMIIPPVRG